MSTIDFYKPKMATKQLQLQNTSAGRKLVVSTNWLPLFGFEANTQIVEKVLGSNQGLEISLATEDEVGRFKKVYTRTYKSRKNNPLETLLDIRSQEKINEAFGDCSNVHIIFTYGKITIKPIEDKKAARIKKAKSAKGKQGAFVCCSSGIDAMSIEEGGFRIDTLLEYRPNESRDKKKDYSETGALCAISNVDVKNLINEDIFTVDTKMLEALAKQSNTSLFSISTSCDDFSPCKTHAARENSLCDLSTGVDMIYPALKIIEAGQFPFIILENVQQLLTSQYHTLFETTLRRFGYRVYSKVIDASLTGGRSKRKRAYVFATTFEDIPFSFPKDKENTTTKETFWEQNVEPFIADCRDVTHSKSIQDGAKCKRLRTITKESTSFPTLLKSQSRMAKDSLVIQIEDRYLFPSEALEKHIMGVPEGFTLEGVGKGIGSEILGQAVEYLSHKNIIQSIQEHIKRSTTPQQTKIRF
jgi:DNA (cytosine-5)-methyltransferase 1